MDKFCIFCGKAPEAKNREHVIPRWLIELTGNPDRVATFGVDFHRQPFAARKFAFDSFVFPACSACNTRFSKLEEEVKPIFIRLLSHKSLSSSDLILLLDWLDKVRVGLWLGYLYLDKNPLGIEPSFHIDTRIGRADRMVGILKVEDASTGLTFCGPGLMGYQLSPTCFGLRVNGMWLTNASGVSLCSQRLGFPYLEPTRINEDHKLEVLPKAGTHRLMNPVERRTQLARSIQIYQPIFRAFYDLEKGDEFLQNGWLKERSADIGTGYGKLFLQKPHTVELYSESESSDWVPGAGWKSAEAEKEVPRHIYDRLRQDFENGIQLTSSKEHRKHMRAQAVLIGRLDRAMLMANEKRIQENAQSLSSSKSSQFPLTLSPQTRHS